ncbi:Itc1p KNAG_0F01880 [Huiozyma naganishii CBS 8797]|uniref:WAC domain-containing protein n=1 Tax=Huiozyma naganishii (strain ATCC MYA-139 / BCRC 22969 / CBS 8797 / KCTC 17520 / NBRC 10181 / NCYC 3082 / Yp74L-3) TaxID=1071383 RepID=J7S8C9_HUIN7|nr:hypothetical protein KNAG_0F01880 [Kazachstania naganishii CBS 8797]CCK70856.1 hypothetical protein KNAG_0F01880 [Kazachstania naganishii CBS 8797]
MVLYKRKPIVLPNPGVLPRNLDISVWHIDETGEWFFTYEEYLNRLDFYTKHNFTCEITGTSCLTFFQALDSEETQFRYVEDKFPLKLREPVARFLHFNEIRRLDALVEKVYAKFKNDFFPGEIVYLRKARDSNSGVTSTTSSKQNTPQPAEHVTLEQPQSQRPYVIKEKVQFNASIDPVTKDEIVPGHSKYMLAEDESLSGGAMYSKKLFVADQSQIYRDRSTFTKHLIKCFFKITLHRASSKMGAPWCVKPEYLKMYGLTMDWPASLAAFKDDEPVITRNDKNEKKIEGIVPEETIDSIDKSNLSTISMTDQHPKRNNDLMDGELPEESNGSSQKKPKNAQERNEGEEETNPEPTPDVASHLVITSIVNDMEIPYTGRPPIYVSDFSFYNEKLEGIPVCIEKSPSKKIIPNFERLLQVYQFVSTFNTTLMLSNFSFDELVTSFKCTDAVELKGETVHVSLNNVEKEDIDDKEDSSWQRNPKVRQMIKEKNVLDQKLSYKIVLDDPASDEVLDNINGNGSGLLIEIFSALLSLFIDENGEWSVIIFDEWTTTYSDTRVYDCKTEDLYLDNSIEHNGYRGQRAENEDSAQNGEDPPSTNREPDIVGNNNFQRENEEDNDLKIEEGSAAAKLDQEDVDMKENVEDDEQFDDLLNYCLNYRNVSWAERLTKRQFNNGMWVITLLGVFQDSIVIPKYSKFIHSFSKKIVPNEINANQLPKQLWRNFCRNLTLDEKITSLWILVEVVANFSPAIKNSIEESMELCMQIRSERFRVSRLLKTEMNILASMEKDNESPEYLQQKSKTDSLQCDKNILDKKLMENDYQRLKALGHDRYANRYFWLDLTGIPNCEFSENETRYNMGRLWVQGPSTYNAKKFLSITDEELEKWKQISREKGNAAATKEVFDIYRTESGSYNLIDRANSTEIELLSAEGESNKLISLTPIQRKILDETPDCLLLDSNKWYYVEKFDHLKSVIEWFDTWGRKEHDLLRQFKSVINGMEDTFLIRNNCLNLFAEDPKELKLLNELNATDLTDEDFVALDLNDELGNVSSREKTDESTLEDIESKLDDIAEQIMKLDDSSKTRNVLQELEDLEKAKDDLLKQKQQVLNTQGNGTKMMARGELKRRRTLCRNKISTRAQVLTYLLNYRHFRNMENVISWKNKLAITIFGNEIRKNAFTSKKKYDNIRVQSVEEKLKDIIDQTSKMTHSGTSTVE